MKLKDVIYLIIIGILAGLFFTNKPVTNKVVTKIDSVYVYKQIPEKKGQFLTKNPKPIIKKIVLSDSLRYKNLIEEIEKKYTQKADSVTLLQELLQATKLRLYKETFEDSILTAKVKVEAQGKVKSIDFSYTTKPQKFGYYEKTITKEVKPKFNILLGGKLTSTNFNNASFEVNLGYQNSNLDVFELGVNTNKQITIGFKKSLFTKY